MLLSIRIRDEGGVGVVVGDVVRVRVGVGVGDGGGVW